MSRYKLSARAFANLEEIVAYTTRTWGHAQCERYVNLIEAACEEIAVNPELDRLCHDVRPGLMRSAVGQHVLFYRRQDLTVRIVAILHRRMVPARHLADEDG